MLAIAAVVIGVGGGLAYVFRSRGLQEAANWAQLVSVALAVAPLIASINAWRRRPAGDVAPTATPDQLDKAQRTLAALVLVQWREEIPRRQLDDPHPLAVYWRLTDLAVMDHAEHVVRPSSARRTRGRPRFSGSVDRIDDLARQFRQLVRRRLVILGEAGMGKTTLAVLLLRELLERPQPGDPVPVLFSIAGWHPRRESLRDWLTRQLDQTYPALRAAEFGPNTALALVRQRRILPVLDGLDELPSALRPAVIAALNGSLTSADPLILTCRTSAYQVAITAPGGDVLTGGAVIEPDSIRPADAADYLTHCLPPQPRGHWPELIAAFATGGPVADALATPVALWLLRKVYVDTGRDPKELQDSERFPTASAIVEHLIDHLVHALITANPTRQDTDFHHPFQPQREWAPADAKRWLTFLARHLRSVGSRDFAWWTLYQGTSGPRSQPARPAREPAYADLRLRGRTVLLLRALVVNRWALPGLTSAVLGAMAVFAYSIGGRLSTNAWEPLWVRLGPGLGIGLLLGVIGPTAALVAGLFTWATAPMTTDQPQTPILTLRRDLRLAFVRAALLGLACGLVTGLMFGFQASVDFEFDHEPMVGFLTLFTFMFLVMFPLGFIAGAVAWLLGTSASGTYLVTVCRLKLRRQVPLRLMKFLEDAHRLGLLRQIGAVYQFRHAILQDHLARER